MKTLDKGQDKIKKISEGIKLEILEPAREEAQKIIQEAQDKAREMIHEAEKHGRKLIENAKQEIEHEKNVFHSSLTQSAKQTVESLKQSIENKLFTTQLQQAVTSQSSDPKLVAAMITAIIQAIEKEGLSADIQAVIPKTISAQQVNELLSQDILGKLHGQSVMVGEFSGGAQVKLVDKQLTLDITDKTLVEYLQNYIRKDFRKLIFS